MDKNKFTPAKPKIVALASIILLAGIALFTAVLCITMQRVTVLNKNDYVYGMPNNFMFKCDVEQTEKFFNFNGYAFIFEEHNYNIETYVVLYHSATDTYFKLPTLHKISEEASASVDGSLMYQLGGFEAQTAKSALKYPLETYELCFVLRSDSQGKLLIPTGTYPLAEVQQ